jgi:hypothetical protein
VAQNEENERDAAHVTATATVRLLRTLRPNSAVAMYAALKGLGVPLETLETPEWLTPRHRRGSVDLRTWFCD